MARAPLEGDKWGALECIYVGTVQNLEVDGGGGTTITIDNAPVYQFRCECGNVKQMRQCEFRGKRAQRDCGCGTIGKVGRSVIFNISIDSVLRDRVEKWARKEQVNVSQMASRLMRLGIEKMEKQKEAAQ